MPLSLKTLLNRNIYRLMPDVAALLLVVICSECLYQNIYRLMPDVAAALLVVMVSDFAAAGKKAVIQV